MYHKWCWLKTEWPEGHTKLGSLNYNSLVVYKTSLYLFGGFGENGSGLTNLWCLKNHVWGILKTSGKTPSPRYKHRACVASDRMWIFGGCQMGNKQLGDFYLYEFSTNKWKRIKSKGTMPCARFSHTLTTYDENRIILHGGVGPKKIPLNDLWIYTISENRWVEYLPEQEQPQPIPRHLHTTVVMNKELFVFGGTNGKTRLNTLSKCEFLENTVHWSNLAPYGNVPTSRRDHSAVAYQNKMFIFGGYRNESLNELWMYEYYTNSWTRLSNYGEVPCARHHHSAIVIDDTMYIYGGWIDPSVLYDLHTLNISGDIVTTIQFNKLKEGCNEMYENQEFCDLEIKTKDENIRIHDCVMKARTGLFGNYYYSRNKNEKTNFQFNSKTNKRNKLIRTQSLDSSSSSSSSSSSYLSSSSSSSSITTLPEPFSTTNNTNTNINITNREENSNEENIITQLNGQTLTIEKNNSIQNKESEDKKLLNNEPILFTIFDDLKKLKLTKKTPIEILNEYTKNESSHIIKAIISFIYTGEFDKELLFSKINKKIKKFQKKKKSKIIINKNNNDNTKETQNLNGNFFNNINNNNNINNIKTTLEKKYDYNLKGNKIPKQFLTRSLENYERLNILICALKIVEVLDIKRLLQIIQTEIEMRIHADTLITILVLMYQKKVNCLNFRAYLFNRLRRYRESVSNSIDNYINSRKLLVDMLKAVCGKSNLPCDYNKNRYPAIVSDYQFLFDTEVKYFNYKKNKNNNNICIDLKNKNKLIEKESEKLLFENNLNGKEKEKEKGTGIRTEKEKEKEKGKYKEKEVGGEKVTGKGIEKEKEKRKDKEKENYKEKEKEKEKGKGKEKENENENENKKGKGKEKRGKKCNEKDKEIYLEKEKPIELINSDLEDNLESNQKINNVKNDFIIKCFDGEIHLHKPILLAHSELIKTAVQTLIGKKNENEIITEFFDKSNRSTESLYCLIRFIYTGKFDHILNNFKIAYELLGASAYYQLKDDSLDHVCSCVLKNSINQENVLYLLNKAENLQIIELRDYAMKFTLLHSKSVLTKENLKKITDVDLLRELLSSKLDD
ncbi:leucine-zipper-like transcriptional regulator [Anaeramoeba flamelloides]|uniref:Leucine-zipper-like transcriptional regulator n=1 Tax=Anaeramoeba flamelloides TaxID=1746091 RepID=A0AAV7ZUK0_9EUKA|nr:leucine-zipper-like transcriptional regulator [Anaeramoeba flamelloides]